MTQVIIPANATEAEEDRILGAAVEAREGQERIRVDLNEEQPRTGRGWGGPITHVDESPFINAKGVGGYVAGQECYPDVVPLLVPETETEYLNQGVNGKRLAESIAQVKAGETEEHALDESFALAGDEETPPEVLAQIDESRKEMQDPDADVKRTQVAVIGAKPVGAAALLAAGLAAPKAQPETVEQPKPGNLPDRRFMSNAEKKRRAATQFNEELKAQRLTIVKLRTIDLKVKIELIQMTNRMVNMSKERGLFAVYTKNSAVAATGVRDLPACQHRNYSAVNYETLDWLLDQIGETAAYEVRTGRLQDSTPRTFFVEKSEAEWTAKGFHVKRGQVHFFPVL